MSSPRAQALLFENTYIVLLLDRDIAFYDYRQRVRGNKSRRRRVDRAEPRRGRDQYMMPRAHTVPLPPPPPPFRGGRAMGDGEVRQHHYSAGDVPGRFIQRRR